MKNNIMLDLETMGTSAGSAILAIGAVKFDTQVTDRFYEVIDLASCVDRGLAIDPSTVLWWMQQSDQARAQFDRKGLPLEGALGLFSAWVGPSPIIWGNGSDFDNAILSAAYKACRIAQPWAFYNNRCYRTMKSLHPNVKLSHVGVYHNAVDDAESQALHLINILGTAHL